MKSVHIVLRGSLYVFPSPAIARMFCGAWTEWRSAIDLARIEYGEELGQYRDPPDPSDYDGTFIARPLVIEDVQDARECSQILDLEIT